VRICSDGKRTQHEIAHALGMTVGGIQYTIGVLLRDGALHSDAVVQPGTSPKPSRGDQFWADDEQLAAAEEMARSGHDNGRLLEGDLLLLVRGPDVAALRQAMRPALTAVTTRWAVRLIGDGALWLLAIGPDRDMLLIDQLAAAIKESGGRTEAFSAENLLDGASLRAYMDAATNPPSSTRN
jgi:hypothetical protein